MASKRLTTARIQGLKVPGCYGDGRGGHGLQIRVHRTVDGDLSASFRQKLTIGGKPTTVGLGPWPVVSLENARKAAFVNRAKVYQGIDPRTDAAIVAASQPVAPIVQAPKAPSFEAAAEATIQLHREGWKEGSETEARWRRSVAGLPFARKAVSAVVPGDVLAVIQPDWLSKPVATANRLNVLRAVFRWSIGAGHRTDDPTDRVRGALPRQKARPKHHRAVPVADVPQAIEALRQCSRSRKVTRLAIEFAALTASRPGEAKGATWSEIDGALWTVPAARMKAGREHRVPLSAAALAVLRAAARETGGRDGLIFPSTKGTPLHGSALAKCLKVCGIDAAPHGFRSTFRDWCAETGVAREVAEASLAHVVKGVEGAYFRSDLLARRRDVMQAWAEYLA